MASIISLAFAATAAASVFEPIQPPSFPLAVKSPYMNTWLNGNGGELAGSWPVFYDGTVTAWTGLIYVDDKLYNWMGRPSVGENPIDLVEQISAEYTASTTKFIQHAGGITLTVSFTTPVPPNDLKVQSIIGSYLEVSVQTNDDAVHNVALYADISAEWVVGNVSQTVEWNFQQTDVLSHAIWRQEQIEFCESDDKANWGTWYWTTSSANGPETGKVSYQSGSDMTVRQQFVTDQNLSNSIDTNYRGANVDYPVFGFAHNFENVAGPQQVLYTLIHAQEHAIQYRGEQGVAKLPPLWTRYWNSTSELVSGFFSLYSSSMATAATVDSEIKQRSIAAGGQNYSTITTLSVRQAFAALQLVATSDLETEYAFMKEISSDGNVNTVDVIYPALPIFLVIDPWYVKALLNPLFEVQEAGLWPEKFAVHDIGTHYPNAVGHPEGTAIPEAMPLEECGNMIIASLAYAMRSGDWKWLKRHYTILKQWNEFLIEEALIPDDQLSTDDFAGKLTNQTNLALKGIIGIEAMARIAEAAGEEDDANRFKNISRTYLEEWQTYAIVNDTDKPHTNLQYCANDTHGLLYNLYADKLLQLDFIPGTIYEMQSEFYPNITLDYGVPLDTRHKWTKSDWQMWSAAVAYSRTREIMIDKLTAAISSGKMNTPLGDLYDAETGEYAENIFKARPVVGGHFALLALAMRDGHLQRELARED